MQTSLLSFLSKPQKLVELLELSDELSLDGPKKGDCPTSDTVIKPTGALSMTLSAGSPMVSKKKRSLSKESKPVKRQRKQTPESKPSTPGYPPGSSLDTSKTKSKIFIPSTHPPSCLEIVRLDLISGERAYSRFYNRSLRGVYESCTLPTEIDYAASHTISSKVYSSTVEQQSLWKHTIHRPPSLPMTSSLSKPFLPRVALEAPKEEPIEKKLMPFQRKEPMKGRPRSYKNRMLPTKEQWIELKKIFAVARTAYNFANKRIRDDKAPIDVIGLRKDWVRSDRDEEIKSVSSLICSNAIKELVTAYKTNETKKAKNPKHEYEIKDRTSDAKSEVVHIERVNELLEVVAIDSVATKRNGRKKGSGVVPTTERTKRRQQRSTTKRRVECGLRFGKNLEKVGPIRIQGTSKIIQRIMAAGAKLHAAALIQWDKIRNAFYFIWVDDVPVPPDPDPTFENKRIVSLDPGSAPFQQWYSPTSGEFGELLCGTSDVLRKRRDRVDKLRKRVNGRVKNPQRLVTKRQRTHTWRKRNLRRQRTTKTLRRKLAREQQRTSSYMEAAHYDAAHFLLKRHDIVIAPVLQTGWLMAHKNRKGTGNKLSRALYTWAHRLFRQRLAYTASRYPGRFVFECAEPGTSKTCTHCGAWKGSLRLGDKVYSCPHCGVHVNRQIAGARNNFFAAYGMAVGLGWDGVGD